MMLWGILGAVVVFIITVTSFCWSKATDRRWLRFFLRVSGYCGIVVMVAGAGLLLLFGLAAHAPEAQFRTFSSPDGVREAILSYNPGFLGGDVTFVEIKKKNEPWSSLAFKYSGSSDIDRTLVRWTDNSHLEILYYSANDRGHDYCASPAEDITVTCTPLADNRTD